MSCSRPAGAAQVPVNAIGSGRARRDRAARSAARPTRRRRSSSCAPTASRSRTSGRSSKTRRSSASTWVLLRGSVGRAGGRLSADRRRAAGEASTRAHVDELRQMASNAAAEQRRCLRSATSASTSPLPHERLRPLLNEISVTTRDQLTAFCDLGSAATCLEQLLRPSRPPPPPDRNLDRRALFTRILPSVREECRRALSVLRSSWPT